MTDDLQQKIDKDRQRMLASDLKGRGIKDANVLRVMAEIPRELFVPPETKSQAYNDGPLPIGLGQTISQPYIVALMTEELRAQPNHNVLEIGTGSGYQTAILSRLAKKVYTVERLDQLSLAARDTLKQLGITNVEFQIADGSCGWPDNKTFDRIIITAAVPTVPQPIMDQLTQGGLIVAPVGGSGVQRLIALQKKPDTVAETFICDVRFVKLIGECGFNQ